MEREFAALGEHERVARCLELAQSELDRADACGDATARELHLSLAECWRSMAKQFETLESVRTGMNGRAVSSGKAQPSAEPPPRAEFDLPFGRQKTRFAT